jgi:DNA-binding LacI/PurR family transcriptional regulator
MRTKRSQREHGVPKYPWVKELIHHEIVDGKYPPGLRLPTEMEWAQKLRVTAATVSRALNELEQSGLIVRRRGSGSYVADPQKRQVFPGRKLKIGILYNVSATPSVIWNGFLAEVAQGLLYELGMSEVPPAFPETRDDEDTRIVWQSRDHNVSVECLGEAKLSHARHPTLKAIREGNFDALATVSIVEDDWLRELLAIDLPIVLADYAGSEDELDADIIYLDPSSGYRRATRHLVSLNCKRLHFVGSLMSAATPQDLMSEEEWRSGWNTLTRVDPDTILRLNAFRSGMDECGLPLEPNALHFVRTSPAAMSALAEQLASLPVEQRPDGVVCHSIEQAESLIADFSKRGLPLQGAGTTLKATVASALPILADARTMGSVAAELLTSRLIRSHRPHMRVGVKMLYRSPDKLQPGGQAKTVAHIGNK